MSSLSTLSMAIVISGRSVNRFISKICLGTKGRKDKKSEAPAILNMLPKLALVAINMYFIVFANVRRPSITPSESTARSFSRSTMSAASLATSTAVSTEMPTSAL